MWFTRMPASDLFTSIELPLSAKTHRTDHFTLVHRIRIHRNAIAKATKSSNSNTTHPHSKQWLRKVRVSTFSPSLFTSSGSPSGVYLSGSKQCDSEERAPLIPSRNIAKSRTIAVRLISMALTGYYKTLIRPRQHRPLSMLKYDPVGKLLHTSYVLRMRRARCVFCEQEEGKE